MPDSNNQDANTEKENLIDLSELIAQVKTDLLKEVKKNTEDEPLLFVDEIEVSAQVVASKTEGGKAGVKLSVLNFGVDGGVHTQSKQQQTHTIKIKLSPLVSKQEYLTSLTEEEKKQHLETAKQATVRSGGKKNSLDEA
ncbi:trypco2 family protein [Candidatus Venteria ishoeyi]|uniref:Trypsin-co-occurring domain-containing protein n=1 Tax=Candidatus Venteria ishoeyi TaxID=1899563 RepID=A0A1H6F7F8_9GAMM|nr:trypco2 family protein [Candidatus Venteria ishoeyi]SEH05006.1 Uncharacterised protein [Candidatus Venteria ishoeyi]